jgi:hypothetical protein
MLSMGCDPLDLDDLRQDWHPNFRSVTFDSEYQFPTAFGGGNLQCNLKLQKSTPPFPISSRKSADWKKPYSIPEANGSSQLSSDGSMI